MDIEKLIPEEDQDLDYVRIKRKAIIDELTKNVKDIDTKEASVIGTLLTDMDRTALAKKRIKNEEQSNKNNGEAAALIAQMLVKLSGANMNPYSSNEGTRPPPELPADLPPPNITPGLLDENPRPEYYAEFSKRMQEINNEEDEI